MRIDDGHSTTISFADFPTVKFWEKEVTPPGVDGGGPNDTTTMRNVILRTMAPKKLKTMTEMTFTAAYDPEALQECFTMANINQLLTVNFPDGSQWTFWGWLDKMIPDTISEGSQPTATVTIQPSNQNASGVETIPIFTPAP